MREHTVRVRHYGADYTGAVGDEEGSSTVEDCFSPSTGPSAAFAKTLNRGSPVPEPGRAGGAAADRVERTAGWDSRHVARDARHVRLA